MEQYKTCTRCKQTIEVKFFSFRKAAKDKLTSWCKPCMAENARQIRQRNPEAIRESNRRSYRKNRKKRNLATQKWRRHNKAHLAQYQANWRSNNRSQVNLYSRIHGAIRRARLRAAKNYTVTSRDIKSILARPCIYCGAKASHLDHIIPIARGGVNGIGNLAASCSNCNLSKNDRLVMEWRIWKMRLSGSPSQTQSDLP